MKQMLCFRSSASSRSGMLVHCEKSSDFLFGSSDERMALGCSSKRRVFALCSQLATGSMVSQPALPTPPAAAGTMCSLSCEMNRATEGALAKPRSFHSGPRHSRQLRQAHSVRRRIF